MEEVKLRKKKPKRKKIKIFSTLNLIRLLKLYVLGIVFFMFFTIPTLKVNTIPVGFQTKSSFKSNMAKGKDIKIKGKDGDQLDIASGKINYIAKMENQDDFNQNALIWPYELIKGRNIESKIKASYDYDKLKTILLESFVGNEGEKPENAKIVKNEESGIYEIQKEKYGSQLDFKKATDRVTEFLDWGKYANVDISDQYESPTIFSDNPKLVKKLENVNKIKDMKITYDFFNAKEVLEGEQLIQMFDDVNGELKPNPEKTKEWLVELAIKYDTFGSNRKFKAKDLGEITVPPGIYGWEMSVDKTNDQLIKILSEHKSAEVKPEYRVEGIYRDDYNDIGPTYVEVDIGRQHMWYFKDGKEVYNAPFVSGKDVDGRRTPLGVNQLWSKQRDTYLTGSSWRSHVNYWMPIDWTGVGFHDASWRGSFGGQIYKTSGSHGCLNMSYGQAAELYNLVELYTPVVVYDSTKL